MSLSILSRIICRFQKLFFGSKMRLHFHQTLRIMCKGLLLLEPSLLVRNNAMFKSKEELEHRDKGDFEALLDVAGGKKNFR